MLVRVAARPHHPSRPRFEGKDRGALGRKAGYNLVLLLLVRSFGILLARCCSVIGWVCVNPPLPPSLKRGDGEGRERPRAIALCECLNRGWMFSVVQLVLPGLYEQPCNVNTGGWLLLLYTCFGLYGVTCKAPLWIYSHICRFFCCSNITSYATSRKFHAKGPWRQEACYVGRLLG